MYKVEECWSWAYHIKYKEHKPLSLSEGIFDYWKWQPLGDTACFFVHGCSVGYMFHLVFQPPFPARSRRSKSKNANSWLLQGHVSKRGRGTSTNPRCRGSRPWDLYECEMSRILAVGLLGMRDVEDLDHGPSKYAWCRGSRPWVL
jgi:hypothetical protein